jgi:hypothetical protein
VDLYQETFDIRVEVDINDEKEEGEIIKKSGIEVSYDSLPLKIGKATQEQIDYLKKNDIKVYPIWEWVPIEKQKNEITTEYKSEFVPDAYQDIVNLQNEKNRINNSRELWSKDRIYRDLDGDSIPELFIQTTLGNGSCGYIIYRITKDGYRRMGGISYQLIEILPTKHNGFFDIVKYGRLDSDTGYLSILEFNGSFYETKKGMWVVLEDAINNKIIESEVETLEEYDPKWSSKDDDKYRKNQNTLLKKTFEVRIEMESDKGTLKELKQREEIIKNSGIIITFPWGNIKFGKATQEQFDAVKKAGIAIYRKWEWIPVKATEETKDAINFTKNPYLDYWNLQGKPMSYQWLLARFYQDINLDGIPEVIFPRYYGSQGSIYSIFQITKEGYLELGAVKYELKQILPTKHNGQSDLMLYWILSKNPETGNLTIVEFDGTKYRTVREMYIYLQDAKKEKIFTPMEENQAEFHPYGDKLLWSPKDDDQYRRMIK